MKLRSCVHPSGRFIYGLHKPSYSVANFREQDLIRELGKLSDGSPCDNRQNFPQEDVSVPEADWIFEIPNPFAFRGTTFISRSWAEPKAEKPSAISLPPQAALSMHETLKKQGLAGAALQEAFKDLPEPLLLTLAASSTDSADLILIARMSCDLIFDEAGSPNGLCYEKTANGTQRAVIHRHDLFETVVNNYLLPDSYKEAMVLRPGVQGGSEIVGEFNEGESHVYEYLRRNSYIGWGHYASNMADDAVRYRTQDLNRNDMHGLRHLYYQRTYLRLAELLGLELPGQRKSLSERELEDLRLEIVAQLKTQSDPLPLNGTLWGWNFGFDFAASGYRLHASHQQIHQQFAMLPQHIPAWYDGKEQADEEIATYGCGDLIADFCRQYKGETGQEFFKTYIKAIRNNSRLDKKKSAEKSLIVFEDDHVILFVPKAQTSQWELQLMPLAPVGNIIEAGSAVRKSLDTAILIAQQIYAELGAKMVTSIEFSKRLNNQDTDQRLLYAFLPKLPYSMGAFSEAQLRWINGHFPEDFATACRARLAHVLKRLS